MNVEIKNCNNIDNGRIEIQKNKLNIKYAINGTGKTTIADAIELSIKNSEDLKQLIPFKYKDKEDLISEKMPSVSGVEDISSLSIFNEEYVGRYIFLPDEVIENSFEIFIKNKDYEQRMEQIEKLIIDIKETFTKSEELETLIRDIRELSSCFGKSKSGYSAAGSIGKGIGRGNKLEHIPKGLEVYEEFLRSDSNTQWLKWQMTGNSYIDLANKCPYCTSSIESKKETVLLVGKEYDAKMVEHLNKIISVFQRLNKYFTDDTNEKIKIITHNLNGITKEQITFLIHIKDQIDNLAEKLSGIKELGYYSFKEVEKVVEIFNKYKIDIVFYTHLNTEETKKLIKNINSSIDEVLNKAGKLQGEINQQTINIQKTIKKYKEEINAFLKYAGYRYHVDIELDEDEKYRMRLKHYEYAGKIDAANKYLSFGERNAFSLILFMYETLKNTPDLIILDDPISSFDKHKKFAILNMLFRGGNSFQNKTVLMLTHDFEPIIDMLYNLPHKFNPRPYVAFLRTRKNILKEIEIKKEDIKTFVEITNANIANLEEDINKIIYLRRLYEISINKNETYELISNLLHKRQIPMVRVSGDSSEDKWRDMTPEEIKIAEEEIRKRIPSFNYERILTDILNNKKMVELYNKSSNNYEKLQIYRIIFNDNHDNEILRKFVNETFHIENDYILQLNPCKYEIVPQYIIDECDEDLRK